MKRITANRYLWVIGLLFVSSSVMAQYGLTKSYYITTVPTATMRSVNNSDYMTVGSTLSSEVYDIGTDDPYSSSDRKLRKAGGPGTIDTETPADYDPDNPQFAPVGDSIIPLLIIALIYALMAFRRKSIKR